MKKRTPWAEKRPLSPRQQEVQERFGIFARHMKMLSNGFGKPATPAQRQHTLETLAAGRETMDRRLWRTMSMEEAATHPLTQVYRYTFFRQRDGETQVRFSNCGKRVNNKRIARWKELGYTVIRNYDRKTLHVPKVPWLPPDE